jgi:hypothetical protein
MTIIGRGRRKRGANQRARRSVVRSRAGKEKNDRLFSLTFAFKTERPPWPRTETQGCMYLRLMLSVRCDVVRGGRSVVRRSAKKKRKERRSFAKRKAEKTQSGNGGLWQDHNSSVVRTRPPREGRPGSHRRLNGRLGGSLSALLGDPPRHARAAALKTMLKARGRRPPPLLVFEASKTRTGA